MNARACHMVPRWTGTVANHVTPGKTLAERSGHVAYHKAGDLAKAFAFLKEAQAQFAKDRYVFVPGKKVADILKLYKASNDGMAKLSASCDHCPGDPTLPFRQSMTARIALNLEGCSARRLARSGFVLDSSEGFNRHDSGAVRYFDETPNEVVINDAYQALIAFKADVMRAVSTPTRGRCDPMSRERLMTAFHLRTITTKDVLGEPAAEGVHMDGVEYTMTTMLKSSNMHQSSAFSRLHSLEQPAGVPWSKTDPSLQIAKCQHTDFLDTLIIADGELQHSVSELHQMDPSMDAQRDMLVLFTRRPAERGRGHPSESFDNMSSHDLMPAWWSLPRFTPLWRFL